MFNSNDPYDNEITFDRIEKFLAVHGQRGAKTLSMAGKQRVFAQAISSEIGQQLLNDVMVEMEVLLEKIIELKASKTEIMEYKTLRKILNKWTKKIFLFEEAKKKIKEVS